MTIFCFLWIPIHLLNNALPRPSLIFASLFSFFQFLFPISSYFLRYNLFQICCHCILLAMFISLEIPRQFLSNIVSEQSFSSYRSSTLFSCPRFLPCHASRRDIHILFSYFSLLLFLCCSVPAIFLQPFPSPFLSHRHLLIAM